MIEGKKAGDGYRKKNWSGIVTGRDKMLFVPDEGKGM